MSNKHHFGDKSSSIKYCDYHDDTGTMEIGFHSNNTVYHYPDCPKHEFEALKQAASAGGHFHQRIRKYKSVKVK